MRGHLVLVISHPKNPKIENSIGERPFFILNLKVFLPRKSPNSFRFYQIKILTKIFLSPRGVLIQKHSRWEAILSYCFNLIKSGWFWAFSIKSEWFWAFSREKNFKIQNKKWPLTSEIFHFWIFGLEITSTRWPLTFAVFVFFFFESREFSFF